MPEITISRIPDGQRFTLLLETTGRKILGTVMYKTAGSVAVRLDAQGVREFSRLNKKTGEMEAVQVRAAASIEHWSLGAMVEPLSGDAPTP